MKFKLVTLLLFGLVLLSGCIGGKTENRVEEIKTACIELCNEAKNAGVDLSNGPCLSDENPEWNYEDWVCDVAHWPRQDVDNLPQNQCQEYRQGLAHHFVEVDTNCNYIRHY